MTANTHTAIIKGNSARDAMFAPPPEFANTPYAEGKHHHKNRGCCRLAAEPVPQRDLACIGGRIQKRDHHFMHLGKDGRAADLGDALYIFIFNHSVNTILTKSPAHAPTLDPLPRS